MAEDERRRACHPLSGNGTLLAIAWLVEKDGVMNGKRSTILYLHQRAPDAALEALNRLTGLQFAQWPESLVDRSETPGDAPRVVLESVPVKPMKVSG
ncbi:hypothetical protein N5J76_15510 [Pseudomonas sp. GD03855]|nr:hypothetical protein [Stutzerimonas stutzeri]MCQ4255896.1 hypothetical protein [Stutzerimonas stutzeri]MDH2247056.1 hypothetical protein [Pseudomonas sp. GD03856]MDH2266323.1 hypothetical protein [Pseudomonas sp. GD03855]